MISFVFWISILFFLILPVLFEFRVYLRYLVIVYICFVVGFAAMREAELYFLPIEQKPPTDIEFSFNHYKMLEKENKPYLMVWLTSDEDKEYLFVFPYDETTKNLKEQYDGMKQKAEMGLSTNHDYTTFPGDVIIAREKPKIVNGTPKNS